MSNMKKRGYLLVFYLLISLFLINFVSAASIIPGSNSGNLIHDTLRPLGITNPGEIYRDYGYFIDFILFLVIFISISKKFLGERIDSKAATGLGILIAFSLAFFEKEREFRLGDFGALWAVVLLLLIGALAFSVLKGQQSEHKFTGFAIAFLLVWLAASFILNDADREALGLFWGWFQFLALITLIMGIIKLFTWIFRSGGFPTRNELGSIATDIGTVSGAVGKGIGKGAAAAGKGLWKGGKATRKKLAAWKDSQTSQEIDIQSQKLDRLIDSIDNQIRQLNISQLQNRDERVKMLTEIEALVNIINSIVRGFNSKNPEVMAKSSEFNEKYKQAVTRLSSLLQNFYQNLRKERQRILDELRLEASEIKILDTALRQELNNTKKIFNQLQDEVNYALKEDKNPDIENKFNTIKQMRLNAHNTIREIITLVKSGRQQNINFLKQLNDEDMKLAAQFNEALKKRSEETLSIIQKLNQNLGREISLANSEKLRNDQIAKLREQLKAYYGALISLDKEVTEYLFRITNTAPRTP